MLFLGLLVLLIVIFPCAPQEHKCTARNVALLAGERARTAQPLEKYPRMGDILTVWSQLLSRIESMILYDGCSTLYRLLQFGTLISPHFEPCDLKLRLY